MLTGFPATGSLFACNGSPNCHALLFPLYSLGQAFCEKVPFPPPFTTLFPLLPFFFLFFSFLQAAKLNYVRFENLCVVLSFFYPGFFLVKTDCRFVQHAFFRAPQRLLILNSFDRMQ
ncbi:hypothetical protein ACN38_g11912 [Penicillium nordicum]|uniref:Uncharacterized protein n=1 Tax=Penicillium nordicum TaxID=229535 RepID=A0A0M9WAI7_9EURO|nr:hypothetical protein ACN38_g11912 [Penicillium nordicum]